MTGFDASKTAPRLVFVHGIGGLRNSVQERDAWVTALASGARAAGHSTVAEDLPAAFDVQIANYSDLMLPTGAQGGNTPITANDEDFLRLLVTTLVDELAVNADDPPTRQAVTQARAQLEDAEAQGLLQPVRQLSAVLTAVLRIPGLRRGAQWVSGRRLLGALAQVGRYLRRGEPDEYGSLDERVRARVHATLDPERPAVVVSHSLGSVVALEALHDHAGPVPLFVTLGSPLATATVVFDRVRPTPPCTPPTVACWLNCWDRDDIVVARPRLEREFAPNAAGVVPESIRVDSDGVWVHNATKYLAHPGVAGRIVEALAG